MDAAPPRAYRFEGYEVDLVQRRLLGPDGRPVALSSRAYDLLTYLIEHRERVISKNELLKAVWPTTIVEENNLNQAISILRRALGDSRDAPRFIVTVAGRGYRFIGNVVDSDAPAAAAASRDEGHLQPVATASPGIAPAGETISTKRRWLVAAGVAAAVAGGGVWLARREGRPRSVAVLPFKPLVEAVRNEAVQFGLTDTLINRLSELPGLAVSPLSSVRRYSAVDQDPLAAGRELGVAAIVDGHVQIHDDNVRLTARLLDVADGTALWVGRFDDRISNFFQLQEALSSQIVDAMSIRLTGAARQRLLRRETDDVEAWQLYLNGNYHFERRDEVNLRRAVASFDAALQRDPQFALAAARLADAWAVLAVFTCEPPTPAFSRARALAARATELQPDLAEAHTTIGHIRVQFDRDLEGGARDYERALALKPNYTMALILRANLYAMLGHTADGLAMLRHAESIEPHSVAVSALIGMHFFFQRDFAAARAQLARIVDSAPESQLARSFLALVLLAQREPEATLRLIEGRNLKAPWSLGHAGRAYAMLGDLDSARLELAKLEELGRRGFGVGGDVALIRVALGDRDAALAALARAVDDHWQGMGFTNMMPAFDAIRDDPRFVAVLRRVGLG
jgi:DNA-binding winged helix-turn-helix (wHTH) protein/TolB-like protein